MPPAVIAASIATAGALGGAKLSSNAAKSAAKTQEAAGNKALDLQRDIYGQQKTLLNPYVTAGTESLGRLMSSHWGTPYSGPGGPTALAGNPYAPTPEALGIPNGMIGRSEPQRNPFAAMPMQTGLTNPAPMPSLGQMGGPMQPPRPGGPPQGAQGASAGQQMVMVEAPTGERMPLPLPLAQAAQRKGARILGGV
jgi:hypothetical protein